MSLHIQTRFSRVVELKKIISQSCSLRCRLRETRCLLQSVARMSSFALDKEKITLGYRLKFVVRPPSFCSVIMSTVPLASAPVVSEKISSLLQKLAIRVVPLSEAQYGWYRRYFLVLNRDGGLRPILDMRALNKRLRVRKFKMLTNQRLLRSVRPGNWFITIDLKEAYFQRKFLRFHSKMIDTFLVLPFGLFLSLFKGGGRSSGTLERPGA